LFSVIAESGFDVHGLCEKHRLKGLRERHPHFPFSALEKKRSACGY
jgi:hypothetical protein